MADELIPPDVLQAAQDRVFLLLNGAPSLTGKVYQAVPQDTQPPFVVVGDMNVQPLGGKLDTSKRITVDVHFVYRGEERRGLLAMMNAAYWALFGKVPDDLDGVTFCGPIDWLADDTATGTDGVSYAGLSTWEVCAEPA
ncbi:tail completion protein gp17 [Sphingomonas abietis]|uniref:DUF3168 domain-containing protein n=1 Tax=Sphingomonas abietis TaxID=3012344 RepID=A0ABY7NQY2_9SPHN|nr:DUF3168 domain-containing protein [Sphingomonas abietis]WBO23933.1 DUF3168 domain-containing protein [Sphingomonas abietis]